VLACEVPEHAIPEIARMLRNPDQIPADEAGTLESILTGITAGTQLSRICRIGRRTI
jgi:hypothetical protein